MRAQRVKRQWTPSVWFWPLSRVMHFLKPVHRRRNAHLPRLQLQRQELRVMARLVQVAAVEPQGLLLRRLPHVALFALPGAGVLGGGGAEAPALADRVGHRAAAEVLDEAVHGGIAGGV